MKQATIVTIVAAWLNDIRQKITVNAKRLVELADAGVPDRVIDMLIGLSYPAASPIRPQRATRIHPTMRGRRKPIESIRMSWV